MNPPRSTAARTRRSRLALPALALLALALALAACGDDDSESANNGDPGDGVVSTTLDPSDQTTIPELPVNDDISAVKCTGNPQGTVDATKLVGLSLGEAKDTATEQGCSVRVVERNGKGLAVTEDFRPDRINVATEDGDVTAILNLG